MGLQKITFGEMRESGGRGVPVYCSDYRCSPYIRMIFAACDIEDGFVCTACGRRGPDIMPDFH